MDDRERRNDYEIWAGNGLALVIAHDDPDKPALTKVLTLKHRMPAVSWQWALRVYERALDRFVELPKKKPEALTAEAEDDTTPESKEDA